MTLTYQDVVNDITAVANRLGVSPALGIATGLEESGLNPSILEKGVPVNQAGIGIFQLTPGGELGSLTTAQASDPTTNATVALTVFAGTAKEYGINAANPGSNAGGLAFLSQKPQGYTPGMTLAQANATQYAQNVQAAYNDLTGGDAGSLDQVTAELLGEKSLSAKAGTGNESGTVANPAPSPGTDPFTGNLGGDLLTIIVIIGQAIGGLILLILGILEFLHPSTVGAIPELGWMLLGAGATLLYSAIRVKNSVCIIQSAITGKTASCQLTWSAVGFSFSTLGSDLFSGIKSSIL